VRQRPCGHWHYFWLGGVLGNGVMMALVLLKGDGLNG